MKPEIVVVKAIYEPTIVELERDFVLHKLWLAADVQKLIEQIRGKVRAAVTTPTYEFSRRDFETFTKVELVACLGSNVESIDVAAARERSVAVTFTPDSTAEPVADLAIGMLIAVMRRLCEADRFVRADKWPAGVFPSGRGLTGKTCGIVGLGRIGREVARRAVAFGMSVCYHGPHRKADVDYAYFADLESMARESDCLVVTCPLTPATLGIVNERTLRALGAEGYLVNVARGPVVEERALMTALTGGLIAGAALDVFHDEPRVTAELMQLDNVVLAPHIGTSTREIREGRSEKLLADVRAFFAGRPLTYPVEPGAIR